jgi:hypothetical protein
MGLTGSKGIGTDDTQYFAQITQEYISYPKIRDIQHNFSTFLMIFYPFPVRHPLNILIPNLLGITFLPYFTYKLACSLLNKDKVSSLAKKLILFCPFTMANGLILMRDIWIVTFVVSSLYFFSQKKYYIVLLLAFLISFIRFGSMIFLTVGLLILYKKKINTFLSSGLSNIFYISSILVIIAMFFIILPFLVAISGGKLEESIFRESFLTVLSNMDEDAFIVKLMQLPVIMRIPLLAVFFFFAPFLNFKIYTIGVFNIRTIMYGILTPVFLFFCWYNVVKSLLYSLYNKSNIQFVSLVVILFSVCLGIFSLQVRHKTILMPFIYILTAYGFYLPKTKYNVIITVLSTVIFSIIVFVQLMFALT